MLVRVALGQRDATVGDDRTVPVARPGGKARDSGPVGRAVHVEGAAGVVDVQEAAGELRARPGRPVLPGGNEARRAAEVEPIRTRAAGRRREDPVLAVMSPDGERAEE